MNLRSMSTTIMATSAVRGVHTIPTPFSPHRIENTSVLTTSSPADSDSTPFITERDYELFSLICNLIITPVICIFGIIFNALGLGVLCFDIKQQISIYSYLCALTISDIFYLLLGLIRTIPTLMKSVGIENAKCVELYMKRWAIYLDLVISHMSVAMIIVMSFERMIALVIPLKVKTTWFAKHPILIVSLCLAFNVIFLLPYALYLEVVSFTYENETVCKLQFYHAAHADIDRYMIARVAVDYAIPVICLLITNTTIPIKYYRISKRRQATFNATSGNLNNRQMKITLTIFAITFMYILFMVPNLSIKLLSFIDEGYNFYGEHNIVYWFAIDLSNLFTYANAANDCIIYILVSDYYRKIFKRKYCKICNTTDSYSASNVESSSKAGCSKILASMYD